MRTDSRMWSLMMAWLMAGMTMAEAKMLVDAGVAIKSTRTYDQATKPRLLQLLDKKEPGHGWEVFLTWREPVSDLDIDHAIQYLIPLTSHGYPRNLWPAIQKEKDQDAMDVIYEMRSKGYSVTIDGPGNVYRKGWRVMFYNAHNNNSGMVNNFDGHSEGDRFGQAVAKAAILALTGKG